MHFVSPISLDEILSTNLDDDYPYWLGGPINWVVQSYLILRQYREGITISTNPVLNEINVAHVTTWRKLPRQKNEYRVSIRADYRRLFDVDFEILQNPTAIRTPKQIYITYWPVPRLRPRDPSRKTIQNIAYAGRIGNRNLAICLQESDENRLKDFNFKIVDKQYWHDMHEIDVLIAIRDFSTCTYDDKPPSKLINAWRAGIPLIAGYDSAFSAIGTPGVDYIRISTENELSDALERLRDDPKFYYSIVEAGLIKSQEYTREKIAKTWLTAIDNPISMDWNNFLATGSKNLLLHTRNYLADYITDTVSAFKSNMLKRRARF
jgi:hypothetical protein